MPDAGKVKRPSLKTVLVREIVCGGECVCFGGRQHHDRTLGSQQLGELTVCQRAVVGLGIEVDFDHLTPPSWHQDTVQLFCVFTPPVCVDPPSYAPAVDNVEVGGTEVESGLCVRKGSCCAAQAWVSPLIQVVNLEVQVRG